MKKFAFSSLPKGYELYKRIDLTKDRQAQKVVSLWGIAEELALIVPMLFVHPIGRSFDMPLGKILFCIAAAVVAMVVYVFIHEWTHGIFIRLFTGERGSLGFDSRYFMAYARSDSFIARGPYMVIALAPLVIWTIVLAMLLGDIDGRYFWYLYAVQILNVTGAAGDIYVTVSLLRMPKGILARDSGTAMDFYMETKI